MAYSREELRKWWKAREEIETQKKREERAKSINPPDESGLRALALSVIFDVAKLYMPGHDNMDTRECREFFLGKDYQFWRILANINYSGEEFLRLLEDQGGLPKDAQRHVKPRSRKIDLLNAG